MRLFCRFRTGSIFALFIVLTAAPHVSAQGVQTGDVRGVVTDGTGAVVPAVTITLTSPSLQGSRSITTDRQGGYIVRGLPPGTYDALFSFTGFTTVERTIEVPLGSVVEVDIELATAPVTEQVTVVGEAASVIRQPQVAANITKDLVDVLPIGRSPFGIAAIMPGLTTNTPNAAQLTISGSFGYDNVFLVDGTDVNDNLFGSADVLYVEDAIDETQVLTSGISAEYGRFSGGVVNVVSRRGGNQFSGSFRESWSNPTWAGRTPFEESNPNATPRTDKLNMIHEGTFGGPIIRDRLWFFAAGRRRLSDDDRTFPQTGLPYILHSENTRGQLRLTGTFGRSHVLSGQILASPGNAVTPAFGFTIDPAALMRPEYPTSQFVTNYGGTVRSNMFVQVQYSQKRSGIRDSGGISTDIFDSPIVNPNPLGAYNAPYFDAADPEDRDNHQVTGSMSYFFTKWGRHDVKSGAEFFRTTNRGGNSQTATGFVFEAEYVTDRSGRPTLDSGGRLIPTFNPGETVIEQWLPVKGARININTTSLYAQDRWSITDHWSADAGARFELVRSSATGGIVGVDTQTIVPRLGVTFDPRGDGRLVFLSTYGHYAGKYNEAQFSANTNVGNPDAVLGVYVGPPGVGRSFAPGFDPANYVIVDGRFPTANVFFDEGLSSPVTKEFTLQAGSAIGPRGFAKVVYANRRVTRFIEDFVTLDTGSTTVSKAGFSDVFSNIVYRNSDLPQRKYQAIEMFGRYSPMTRWRWNAAWTVQLQNDGNFEGEATNQPGISSPIGEYPEAFNETRHYPVGRLAGFQRHALRLWSTYRLDVGRIGGFDIGGFFSRDSAWTYSLRAGGQPLTPVQRARISGYISQPTSQTIYFAPRGSESFKGYGVFDLALTYTAPFVGSVKPWIKIELYNVFDNQKLVTWNTTVRSDPASSLDDVGLPTGYIKGPLFGQAQSSGNYVPPRAFQMAFGIRF